MLGVQNTYEVNAMYMRAYIRTYTHADTIFFIYRYTYIQPATQQQSSLSLKKKKLKMTWLTLRDSTHRITEAPRNGSPSQLVLRVPAIRPTRGGPQVQAILEAPPCPTVLYIYIYIMSITRWYGKQVLTQVKAACINSWRPHVHGSRHSHTYIFYIRLCVCVCVYIYRKYVYIYN
jgi:hypothetical protein